MGNLARLISYSSNKKKKFARSYQILSFLRLTLVSLFLIGYGLFKIVLIEFCLQTFYYVLK